MRISTAIVLVLSVASQDALAQSRASPRNARVQSRGFRAVRGVGRSVSRRGPAGRSLGRSVASRSRRPSVGRSVSRGFRPSVGRSVSRSSRGVTGRSVSRSFRPSVGRSVSRTSRGFTGRSVSRTFRPAATRSASRTVSRGASRSARSRTGFVAPTRSHRSVGHRSVGHRSVSHRSYGNRHRDYGFHLGFSFGSGPYFGFRYHHPYYHRGHHYGFFYAAPVTSLYVPWGFYCDAPVVYVTREVVVEREVAVEKGDPKPAAETPAAEKLLREASEAFRKANYLASAKRFRLAAIAAPGQAAPLFALGQALLALGSDDAYAARVIRKAVTLDPGLVQEPGDIVAVYKSRQEFEKILLALEARAKESEDARFLLGVNQFLSGDPRARDTFKSLPQDKVVRAFRAAAEKRFKAAEELPPISAPK